MARFSSWPSQRMLPWRFSAFAGTKSMGFCSWSGMRSNNSFKPKLLRYTKGMAGKACHAFGSTTQFGLTQALGGMESIRVVQIAARPGLDSPDVEEVAGAFVNVYTTATSQEKALEIASAEIVQAGWIVLS